MSCWKRPDTTRIVYKSMRNAEANSEHELILFAAISPDDPFKDQHVAYAEEFNVGYSTQVKNYPLSDKSNLRSELARQLDWEYAIVMGSDDIVSPGFFSIYDQTIEDGGELQGLTDIHFLREDGQLLYFAGYGRERQESIGAGRLIKRTVFDRCNWILWGAGLTRNLDASCTSILREKGLTIPHDMTPMSEMVVDVKGPESVTALSKFKDGSLLPVETPGWLRELIDGQL